MRFFSGQIAHFPPPFTVACCRDYGCEKPAISADQPVVFAECNKNGRRPDRARAKASPDRRRAASKQGHREFAVRLLALIEKPDHVCYRYRVQAFQPWLRIRGWMIDPQPFPRSAAEWPRLLRIAAQADAVVVQRKLIAPWWLWALRRAARHLIYDIDDAMFCRDSNSAKPAFCRRRRRRFAAMVSAADAVLAGNRHLAAQAAEFVPADRVFSAPTCVDPAAYRLAQHQRSGPDARLVWIGSRSTMTSLYEAHSGLTAAAARLGRLELRVVCDAVPELPGVDVAFRSWSSSSECGEIADADIGVSWLPDHPWSHGKCGLKVLQYMAAGLPVVANPLGVHCEMVEHGRTGMLAETPQQWAECLAELAADCDLRRKLGRRAREVVERRYSVRRWGREFARLISGEQSRAARHDGSACSLQRSTAVRLVAEPDCEAA